jgi:hypothetical protein
MFVGKAKIIVRGPRQFDFHWRLGMTSIPKGIRKAALETNLGGLDQMLSDCSSTGSHPRPHRPGRGWMAG